LKREVKEVISDAERLLAKAIEETDVNLRDAAEKAWTATVRVTDALILARYDERPKGMKDRREKLGELILREPELDKLGLWERLQSRESSKSCHNQHTCLQSWSFILIEIWVSSGNRVW